MAENFQAGVCGPTWWNTSRSALGLSSPCSPILTDHIGSFGWSAEPLMNLKAATSGNSDESGSLSDEYPRPPQMDSGGGQAVFMDSTLQMLGIDLSSPSSTTTTTTTTTDWNQQSLLVSGRSESNYNPTILQEEMNSGINFRQETGMGCLTPVSGDCTESFPAMSSAYPTTLLQTLLDTNPQQLQLPQQQSLFEDWSLNYSPSMNYTMNLNEFSSPSMRPSLPKQQNIGSWNNSGGSTFFPSAKAQFSASTFEEKRTCPKLSSKVNDNEKVHQSGSVAKRNSNEPGPTFKRTRIETPSPLPTFKVRKEKLGDRITALQQLVSPFGKTDTASVLQEAIEYIKFLHDQVNVLSTPYMKNGAALQHHQNSIKGLKDSEEPKQDLKSRGLCLVPISSTFPVATETTADFWTPTFGGSFR